MEAEKTQSSQPADSFDIYKCMAWLHANRKAVITGTVIVAILGSAIGIYSWKKAQDEMEANAKLFALPPAFVSGEKVAHATPEALSQVAQEFPGTSAGQRAELLAAGTLFTQGKYEQAQTAFLKFLDAHPTSPFCPQASIGVAASMEALAKTPEATEKAIQKYKETIAKYPQDGVVEPAKLTLARLYEEQNKPAEALKYYDELTAGTSTLWGTEAQERKTVLLSKHPELKKAAPVLPTPAVKPAATSAAPAKAAPAPSKAK